MTGPETDSPEVDAADRQVDDWREEDRQRERDELAVRLKDALAALGPAGGRVEDPLTGRHYLASWGVEPTLAGFRPSWSLKPVCAARIGTDGNRGLYCTASPRSGRLDTGEGRYCPGHHTRAVRNEAKGMEVDGLTPLRPYRRGEERLVKTLEVRVSEALRMACLTRAARDGREWSEWLREALAAYASRP